MTRRADPGTARSSSGRPAAISSIPGIAPRSARARASWPSDPMTSTFMARRRAVRPRNSALEWGATTIHCRGTIGRSSRARFKALLGAPAELAFDFRRVDRIAQVVAWPVRHKGDELAAAAPPSRGRLRSTRSQIVSTTAGCCAPHAHRHCSFRPLGRGSRPALAPRMILDVAASREHFGPRRRPARVSPRSRSGSPGE